MKSWQFVLVLVVGISLGVGGMVFWPDVAASYLPAAYQAPKTENITGQVVWKLREGERVLLTVQTTQGAILATFKKKVEEIDLLVQEGDALTLKLSRYEPFVENPTIERVLKQETELPLRGSAFSFFPGAELPREIRY